VAQESCVLIRIDIDCDADDAIRYLDGMVARSQDFTVVLQWAKRYLARANAENFTSGGLPVGGWSPLKPKYSAWKAVRFPGMPLMQQTGRLFRDLSSLNGSPNEINPTNATFGTRIEYAKFHQYGTTRMAKRQIVFEPPMFARELADKAAKHVVGTGGRGLRGFFGGA
jgi:phage gpG-like protein